MDRNLGALTTDYVPNYGRGGMMSYQFGRKDPLPGNIILYKIDGVAITSTASAGFAAQKWNPSNANATTKPDGINVALAVHNPMVLYGANDWSNLNENAYLWFDAKVGKNENLKKSIYDPCPPGWAVAVVNVWQDFRQNSPSGVYTFGTSSTNAIRPGLTWSGGANYYPYVDVGGGQYPVQGNIWYRENGARNSSGGLQRSGSDLDWFLSTPYNVNDGYGMDCISSGSLSTAYNYEKARAMNIRCISMGE